jgi:glyoxylase-like metal-dependent hydrolase (beta-lactamase superfamily II)
MSVRCRLHILQAGACLHPAAMARIGDSLRPVRFPALVGLIIHPSEGAVLLDTGYDPAFYAATRPFPERLYRWMTPVEMGPEAPVVAQLARFGLTPGDIRAVVISHFHGDHIAGLHAFPQARIFCAKAGLAELGRPGRFARVRRGVLAALAPVDIAARAGFFEDLPPVSLGPDLAPFDTGADLFGDGALLAVDLPGHCPGHWGLVLRGEDDRRTFLVADAAWSRGAIRDNVPPPRLTTGLLGRTDVYRRTLDDLHQLGARNPDIVLTPSHCPEAAKEAADGR